MVKYLDFHDPKPQQAKIQVDGEDFDITLWLDRPVSPARKITISSTKKELVETMIFNYWNLIFKGDNPYVKEICSVLGPDTDEYKKTLPEEKNLDPEKPYKISFPFSDDGFRYVTEEERNEFLAKKEAYEKEEQDNRDAKKRRHERLDNIWYIDEGDNSFAGAYENRLLNVFSQEGVSHVDQIPEHVRLLQEKDNTALQLFSQMSGIIKSEHLDDHYVAEIKKALDEYEQMVQAYCCLWDDYFIHIQDLFVRWSVRDLALFARFEKLKKDNKKNIYVGDFRFDRRFFPRDYKKVVLSETDTVSSHNMHSVLVALEYNRGGLTLQDLDSLEHPFLEKLEKSYKRDVQKDILDRSEQFLAWLYPEKEDVFVQLPEDEQLFIKKQIERKVPENRWNEMTQPEKNQIVRLFSREDGKLLPLDDDNRGRLKNREKYRLRHGWFHSFKMQKLLHVDKQVQERRQYEAKKEIIQDFGSFFDDVQLPKFHHFHSITLRIEKSHMHLRLPRIPRLLEEMLSYQKDFGCNVSVDTIKEKIVKKFTDFYVSLVEKIKNKEEIKYNCPIKNPDPERIIADMILFLDATWDLLEKLDATVLKTLTPVDEMKEVYGKEYVDYCILQKIKKRFDSVIISSFFDLTDDERERIESIFIEKLTKKYVRNHRIGAKEPGWYFSLNEWGHDAIINWFEDELLELGLVYTLDDLIAWAEKGADLNTEDTCDSEDEECSEENRRKRAKFYIFQRKVIKAGIEYIQNHLLDLQKFHKNKLSMLKHMKHDYVEYYGDENDIVIDREAINKVYYKSVRNKIESYFVATRRFLASPKIKREDYGKPYAQQAKIIHELQEFLHHLFPESIHWISLSGDIEKLFQKNIRYEGQYALAYIQHLSFLGWDMEELLQQIPPEMDQYFNNVFERIDTKRPKILRLCVQYRLFENGIVGGKLHRMVYENILDHSWNDSTSTEDQTTFAITYLSDHLAEIVWNSFNHDMLGWVRIFPFDKELVASTIQEFLEKWKEWLDHQKKLWGNESG